MRNWPGHVWIFILLSVFSPSGWVGCYIAYQQLQAAKLQAAQVQQPPFLLLSLCFVSSAVSVLSLIYIFMLLRRSRQDLAATRALRNALGQHEAARADLQIVSATWGASYPRPSVVEIINNKPRNAVMFYVNNDFFGLPDPARGNDNKYVEIEYSYGGHQTQNIKRMQGQWIMLPEDPWAQSEVGRLTQDVALLQNESASLRAQIPPPRDSLRNIDPAIVQMVRNSYPSAFAQRLAMKRILSTGRITEIQLNTELEGLGFARVSEAIVKPLVQNKAIVDYGEGSLWIKSTEVRRILSVVFQEMPPC